MNVIVSLDLITCVYVGDENIQYIFEMPHTSSIAKRKRAAVSTLVDIGYADANEYNVLIRQVTENGVKYSIALDDLTKYGTKL